MFTFEVIAFVAAAVILCALVLVAAYVLATRLFFVKIKDTQKRKLLVMLTIMIAALVLFTIVFSAVLFELLLKSKMTSRTRTVVLFAIAMFFVIAVLCSVVYRAGKSKEKFFTTKNITRLAVLTALSVVLYQIVKFPLPFIFPSFLDIQFSEMPALLAGFMIGPLGGAIVVIVKILIKLPFTSTGGVGELGDLILGLMFVLSSSVIYRKLRTKKGALISLIIGSVLCVFTAMLLNRYVLIPFYTTYMFPWPALIGMVEPLYPGITQAAFYKSYLWLAVLPFNTLRCIIVVAVTFFMYKPTKLAFGFVDSKTRKISSDGGKTD